MVGWRFLLTVSTKAHTHAPAAQPINHPIHQPTHSPIHPPIHPLTSDRSGYLTDLTLPLPSQQLTQPIAWWCPPVPGYLDTHLSFAMVFYAFSRMQLPPR